MHAPGQHCIEMGQEIDVVAVVVADIFKAVGKVLTAREMLLEPGKAATERMASRVDDLRIRQDEVNQPDVCKVIGHLIDEERGLSLALDPSLLQVTLAQSA